MDTDPRASDSENKSVRKSESFTSLILRTLPSCWRRLQPEEQESDDGGFSDHHLRTKRVKVTECEETDLASSLQIPHNTLRTSFSNPIHEEGRSKHRRIYRKNGKYSLNPPVVANQYARQFYSDKKLLQHYSSCHTFRKDNLHTTHCNRLTLQSFSLVRCVSISSSQVVSHLEVHQNLQSFSISLVKGKGPLNSPL